MPEEEQKELAALYVAKGFTRDEAETIAARMFEDPRTALDTLVREELGLDPDELGSPWGAAIGSFLAFCAGRGRPGAPVPVRQRDDRVRPEPRPEPRGAVPRRGGRQPAHGRSLLYSGFRQMGLGAAAAAVTYGVGRIIGVGVAG